MLTKKSSGAVIFNNSIGEKYFLVLLYGGGHWDFPKGGIEEGESELEAAKREIREETGIQEVEFVEGFRRIISYTYTSNGDVVVKSVVFFLAMTNSFQVVLSREHKAYAWLRFDDALEQLTFKTAKQVLTDVYTFLRNHPAYGEARKMSIA
jgi:bis(5'-nucleosidyl)-tetraphosphatase